MFFSPFSPLNFCFTVLPPLFMGTLQLHIMKLICNGVRTPQACTHFVKFLSSSYTCINHVCLPLRITICVSINCFLPGLSITLMHVFVLQITGLWYAHCSISADVLNTVRLRREGERRWIAIWLNWLRWFQLAVQFHASSINFPFLRWLWITWKILEVQYSRAFFLHWLLCSESLPTHHTLSKPLFVYSCPHTSTQIIVCLCLCVCVCVCVSVCVCVCVSVSVYNR